MTDRPFGIRSLIEDHPETGGPEFGVCWFWCRRHEQAHEVGEACLIDGTQYEYPKDSDCIDVGPFMTEREARRLMGDNQVHTDDEGWVKPLGMEVGS